MFRQITTCILSVFALTAIATADGENSLSPIQASIRIDAEASAKPYDPMIFGGFLEHFDNQIYGGIFEPGSPLADEQGFRTDVLAALKELKVPIIRWPGGCFVDAYHWQKGVGKKREPYGDYRWGVIEPNTFGTDEFVEFCRRIGAEPYFCFNGLASPQENLDWIAYCNATEGEFAEMRKANGHPDPFNVKFWSVGNERYDKAYIDRVRHTAKEMRRLYPDLKIMCAGAQGKMTEVHDYLMDQTGEYLDYVSIHSYALGRGKELPNHSYLRAISRSDKPEEFIKLIAQSLRKKDPVSRIKIAYDEWNLRAWQHPGFPRGKVDDYDAPEVRALVEKRQVQNDQPDQYTMADALFTASFLNACLRHSDVVKMANIAPLVNTRGPLFVHPKGIVKRTHFHALSMYSNLLQPQVVPAQIESNPLEGAKVSTIDGVATVDESGKQWSIALINRHPSKVVRCTLDLKGMPLDGTFKATVLTGDSPDSYNDIERPDRVVPQDVELIIKKGMIDLPPHSLTILDVSAKALKSESPKASVMNKPNVLIVLADDCTFNDLALYGGVNAKTPNIDKLASEGLTFNRAYVCMSMCQPSRAALYSGLFPMRNGCAWNHSSSMPGLETMPQHLHRLGYRVGIAGKVHVKPTSSFPFENVSGFDPSCVRIPTKAHDLTPMKKFMNRDNKAPFCLVVALVEPHFPWVMGDASAYPPDRIALPPNMVDTPETRDRFSRYLAEITYMDGQVGEILTALKQSGKDDNTLVLFSSEQGSQMAGCKFTNWDVGVHTALIARWPGRVKSNQRTDAIVQWVDVLPTLLDIGGTSARIGSFDGKSFLPVLVGKSKHHRDFSYAVHNNVPEGPPYAIRSISDGKYRYIRNLHSGQDYFHNHIMHPSRSKLKAYNKFWPTWIEKAKIDDSSKQIVTRFTIRQAEELYDTEKDPFEFSNLARKPEMASIKMKLSDELDRWLKFQNDPGVKQDTVEAYRAAKEMKHMYGINKE